MSGGGGSFHLLLAHSTCLPRDFGVAPADIGASGRQAGIARSSRIVA